MDACQVTDSDDMPNHRRNDDTDDMGSHRLQAAAESTVAKFSARVITPVLLSALLVVSGFVGTRLVNQLDGQGMDISKIKSDLIVVSTRLDEGALRRIDENAKANVRQDDELSKLKEGVTELRSLVKTP